MKVTPSGGTANATTSSSTITDHAVVRGDGGSRGIQGSGVLIDDSDNVTVNALRTATVIDVDETAAAPSDNAGRGQFWVRSDMPNVPVFTDDAGTDFVLNASAVPDVFSNVKTLGGGADADYSTLAAAITGESTWTVLEVGAGTFTYSTITLPSGKTIRGVGSAEECILTTTTATTATTVTVGGAGCVLENLTMKAGGGTGTNNNLIGTDALVCRNVIWQFVATQGWLFNATLYAWDCVFDTYINGVPFNDTDAEGWEFHGCRIKNNRAATATPLFTGPAAMIVSDTILDGASATGNVYTSASATALFRMTGCTVRGTFASIFGSALRGSAVATGCDMGGHNFGTITVVDTSVIRLAGCSNWGTPPGATTSTEIIWDLDIGWKVSKTANYTCRGFEDFVACDTETTAAFTLTLPPVAQFLGGRRLRIWDEGVDGDGHAGTSGRNLTIATNGSEKINGSTANRVINVNNGYLDIELNADGDEWVIVSSFGVVGVGSPATLLVPMFVGGTWAVDGDGARTNGGGMAGASGTGADATLTGASAAFAKSWDNGDGVFAPLATNSSLTGWTANYQITADDASEAAGDFTMFGGALPFCELAFDLSQAGTWGGDGGIWEYTNGVGSWATLAAGTFYDNTDTTVPATGLRAFQRSGTLTFFPPSAWVSDTLGSQAAYWIRYRITATQVTQEPILNSVEHDIVSPKDGWVCPHAGVVTAIQLEDGASTLHSTADVKFFVMNYTTGATTSLLTFAQDQRRDYFAGLSLAVAAGDELGVVVIQEDGSAEVTNATLHLTIERSG